MKLDLHVSLAFNGQCEAAFRFYERCLNGTITFMHDMGQVSDGRRGASGLGDEDLSQHSENPATPS